MLLADMGGQRRLAHSGGRRVANGVYHYDVEDIRLVTVDDPVPVESGAAFPNSLDQVNGASPRHSCLKIAVAMARCLAEIYFARVEGRGVDFSNILDLDPFGWPDAFWERRLLLVWKDAEGSNHASVGPNMYPMFAPKVKSGVSKNQAF